MTGYTPDVDVAPYTTAPKPIKVEVGAKQERVKPQVTWPFLATAIDVIVEGESI